MTESDYRLLAVDWGTTTRRVFQITSNGAILHRRSEPLGVLQIGDGQCEALLDALREEANGRPMLLSGMIGSDRGLMRVPYVPCPARLADLAAGAVTLDEAVRIVPGVALDEAGRCDVMRGEETIALGGVAAGLVPPNAMLCQPGTHNKWVHVEDGAIQSFRTIMTGELFELLRSGGVLAPLLTGDVRPGPGFAAGVERALDGAGAFAALFSIRASAMLGGGNDHAAFASGLLIGDDVRLGLSGHVGDVIIAGNGALVPLYRAALDIAGHGALDIDAELAFAGGAFELAKLWNWL